MIQYFYFWRRYMPNSDHVVIISAKRTPIGAFQGNLAHLKSTELGAASIQACYNESGIQANNIKQVIMGCVLPAGLGQAPARQACLQADLKQSTACLTINKMCGSGMQSVILAHNNIVTNNHSVIIAGGMESMSQAPYLLPKARQGYRFGHQPVMDHMLLDGLEDAYNPGKSMGYFAEKCANHYNFSRQQQDEFTLNTLSKAKRAIDNNWFQQEITTITSTTKKETRQINQDEGPGKAKAEKIPLLPAAFTKDGTITAASASFISDGAASLLLTKQSTAAELELEPIAKIIAHHTHAQAPEWFTTAPITAIKEVIKKAHWTIDDIDLFEINEAFAVVTMAAIKELSIPEEKVNIHGGACVLGHPIGASGARILVTLTHALRQHNLTKGVAAICIGGGEAMAIAIEAINN
jgi:acetyl-CoA C-acetyltransferase